MTTTSRLRPRPKDIFMRLTNRHSLRVAREKAGYSQRELALLVGCSAGFVGQLEAGSKNGCSPNLAVKIEKRLNALGDIFEARATGSPHASKAVAA